MFVTVPLKGVKKEKVDLYSNEVYIKASIVIKRKKFKVFDSLGELLTLYL